MFDIRQMLPNEEDALGATMYDAIHRGGSPYTLGQRMAWLPVSPRGQVWSDRLRAQHVWVACDAGAPCGFITLDDTGYIDLAFVAADYQGQGAFSQLFRKVEAAARRRVRPLPSLRTHASLMAQPAFAAQGFHVIRHQTVERMGQYLDRAEMEKHLT